MNNSLRSPWLIAILAATFLLSACGSAQSRKAGYVARGMQYFQAGNYDKARIEFSNAGQIDPQDANVRYLLGQVFEKMGNIRGALGQYQAAIDQDPKLLGARAALGRLYLYAGLPDKAMELAEAGLAMAPDNAQLLIVRGGARAQLGSDAAALQDAERAVQLAPSDEYSIALLASLYRKRSQYGEATRVVQTGLQRLPRNVGLHAILADLEVLQHEPGAAEAQLKQIITLEPKVAAHRYQLARFYLQQKNADAAEKTLRDAVAEFPDSIDAKVQLSQFLAAQRGRDAAVAQIGQFLAREPKNSALQLALGGLLAQLGQTDRAEQTFRDVIAHARDDEDPQGLTARDRLASLLLGKNDVPGASAQLAAVLKQSPHDNDALILRSEIALSHGDVMGGIEDLRSVLRDQPNAVPVMRMLARAYRDNGETGLAEETLRGALQVSPKDAGSRFDLAQILIGDGKPDQAQALLEQLGKDDPANVSVQEALYRAQAAQKHDDEARATAQTIERIAPKQGLGYYLEGMVDETDKKPALAAQLYQQALQLQPQAGEPLTALTRLDLSGKQPAAALARLDSVLAKYPTDPVANNLKAEVLMTEGQTDAAVAAYQHTVQVAPNWGRGYDGLALAQLRLSHVDDAIHTLQQGISQTQADPALVTDLSGLYQRLKRPNDAIALYQSILDKNPKSVFAANNLAMLLVTYKQDSASLAHAQRLAEQLSSLSVATVMDTRGWVKFKSGDFHGAESLLQEAVDKSPDTPELRYHLGMAQLRSGEPQAAEQNLESALHSAQRFAGMDDARAALAQLQKGASG